MTTSLMPLLAFLLVIAMIPAALWLLKRTPVGAGAGVGGMRAVATLALSTSQRIVTVEVGRGDQRRQRGDLEDLVHSPASPRVPAAPRQRAISWFTAAVCAGAEGVAAMSGAG